VAIEKILLDLVSSANAGPKPLLEKERRVKLKGGNGKKLLYLVAPPKRRDWLGIGLRPGSPNIGAPRKIGT